MSWAITQQDGEWRASHRFKTWDYLVRRTILICCGVDIAPPENQDNDRVMDPTQEAKHEFLEWVLSRWESGIRDVKYNKFIRGSTLALFIGEGSEEEGWVNTVSRRKWDNMVMP
jgi:hypothetical protein